jgi:ribonuclease BN (tRNA processing enzyme)
MRAVLWGTRGSLSAAGPETANYGGETSCVEVRGDAGALLVLDAGSGARRLGARLAATRPRVDVILTHLHLDHVQGLGFFQPLFEPDVEVHLWGPGSTTQSLRDRLNRYLSPPLFPVHLRDLPAVELHELHPGRAHIAGFTVTADHVCHPGPTLGLRVEQQGRSLVYIPDHEPALGAATIPANPVWTSGSALAHHADVLIHDAQYTAAEYAERIGWGHSTVDQATQFAAQAGARTLVTFHHDPGHSDDFLDREAARTDEIAPPGLHVHYGREGDSITVEPPPSA